MTSEVKNQINWGIRILISILFVVSALSKMDPIWAFEKQLVDLKLTNWDVAHYFTRLVIALELAIGIAILQAHYLKKIVIPVTVVLLAAFCIHLSIEMVKHGAMNGNCGCFGQWLPMTPLEAFIKNVITIGLLVYLYRVVSDKPTGENRITHLIIYYLASALFMFMAFEKTPATPIAEDTKKQTTTLEFADDSDISDTTKAVNLKPVTEVGLPKKTDDAKPNETDKPAQVKEKEPKKVKSAFSGYTFTQGGHAPVKIDEGKQILCMFVPGCDHCREAAKELRKLSKDKDFPKVSILFMDEEANLIPEFFKETQINFPYQVIGVIEFWQKLGNDYNTPGVLYLWNGNVVKLYDGTEANKFDPEDLKKQIAKKLK